MGAQLSITDYPVGSDTEIGEFRTELDAVPTDTDAEVKGPSTSLASIAISTQQQPSTNMQRESIVNTGPPADPSSFPRVIWKMFS